MSAQPFLGERVGALFPSSPAGSRASFGMNVVIQVSVHEGP